MISDNPSNDDMSPTIITRDQHCISRKNISSGCLKVLYTLNDAGYHAFIVGGAVRDLLLGKQPKDFDVATDATPEQVKAEFRNARIIGRRFRIVHVIMGREIIEVSTFRAGNTDSVEIQGEKLARSVKHIDSAHSNSGMILRDNVYGTLEQDVMRRDFTMNALYYTVRKFVVHDYVDGVADLNNRQLRMIGDPEQRYREDPVRILRAIRLSSKLGFNIEEQTAAPIKPLAQLLDSIPAARLFDEILKMFFAGSSLQVFNSLQKYDVFKHLFPDTATELKHSEMANKLLCLAFASTDQRINDLKSVTPAFLLAAILWPALQKIYQQNLNRKMPPMVAMHQAAQSVVSEQVNHISIPKRFSIPMREIWEFQLRLPRLSRANATITHKRFRAAYDFVLLREQSGEDLQGLGKWWTEYQEADLEQREKLLAPVKRGRRHSKSGKRRVKSAEK
ncbi:polynucleotide adenylyltransferase PcnB [Gammaproteobacteria bacterium]|nr:polynucleotide adenylyltransferase PcnB [Gammaproteobacteria bacterium]